MCSKEVKQLYYLFGKPRNTEIALLHPLLFILMGLNSCLKAPGLRKQMMQTEVHKVPSLLSTKKTPRHNLMMDEKKIIAIQSWITSMIKKPFLF